MQNRVAKRPLDKGSAKAHVRQFFILCDQVARQFRPEVHLLGTDAEKALVDIREMHSHFLPSPWDEGVSLEEMWNATPGPVECVLRSTGPDVIALDEGHAVARPSQCESRGKAGCTGSQDERFHRLHGRPV
jgi:hypothetical protein